MASAVDDLANAFSRLDSAEFDLFFCLWQPIEQRTPSGSQQGWHKASEANTVALGLQVPYMGNETVYPK